MSKKRLCDPSLPIICGIYKITSPSDRIYIGQSRDIYDRWENYKRYRAKSQLRLHRSLVKYGWENHVFEIIEQCEKEVLSTQERYWQEYYDVLSSSGMNCKYEHIDGKKQIFCEEILNKFRNKRLTEDHKKKIGLSKVGKKRSLKMIEFLRERMKKDQLFKLKERPVQKLDLEGNILIEYESLKMAEREENIKTGSLCAILRGRQRFNQCIWKYKDETEEEKQIRLNNKISFGKKRPIEQYDLNGNFIREWESKKDAHKATGLAMTAMHKIAIGKQLNPEKFIWKYKELIYKGNI